MSDHDYEEEAWSQFEARLAELVHLLELDVPLPPLEIPERIQDIAESCAYRTGSIGAFIDPTG